MTAPKARGLDVSDNQDPARMRYRDWHALGFEYLYYQVARGLTPTPRAAEHRAGGRAAGLLTGPYMELEGRVNAPAQARLLVASRGASDELPDMVAVELQLTEEELRAFCDEHDRNFTPLRGGTGIDLAIYIGFGVWEHIVPAWARARYAKYKLIFASYPYDAPESPAGQPMDAQSVARRSTPPAHATPLLPAPWAVPAPGSALGYWSWQHSGHGRLPGYNGDLDLEVSSMSADELRASLAPGAPAIPPGAGHGFHGEQSNQIIPLIRRGLELGYHYKGLVSVENPGRDKDAHDLDPAIDTIARFKFPNTSIGNRWENGQNVEYWTEAEHVDCARAQIQMLFDRTNPTERAGIKLYTPGINEWNLDGETANWTPVGHHLHLMMDEAEHRSAEFGQTIRLAVPGIAQGKPEYAQMQQMIATGCFERMAARGDLFTVHAGRYRWQIGDPIPGLGDVIPGAPYCPRYGGSGDGRVNYFYDLGITCDFAVTEGYDGLSKNAPPAARLARMKQTDDLYRHNRHYRFTAWYEFVDNQDSSWADTDFTPTAQSAEFEDEMIREAQVPNPTQETSMPNVSDADYAALVAANNQQTAILAKYTPAHAWRAGDVALAVANPLNVYAGPGTANVYQSRANYAVDMDVFSVSANEQWLEVWTTPAMWVRVADVKLKGT